MKFIFASYLKFYKLLAYNLTFLCLITQGKKYEALKRLLHKYKLFFSLLLVSGSSRFYYLVISMPECLNSLTAVL